MRIKLTREKRILYFKTALRWIVYSVIIFVCFVLMTSGTWLKPVLLVPVAVYISKNSGVYSSAVTGAVCGFLTDIACGKLFGYNAVVLTVFCVLTSVFFELYLRDKFFNYFIISAFVSFVQCVLDYKFYYDVWNYENVEIIFSNVTLVVWAFTVISSVFTGLLLKLVNRILMPRTHLTIEEAIKNN